MSDDLPHRRFRIVLDVQGDTERDVLSEFDNLAAEVREHGIGCRVVQGGSSSGGHVVVTEDPLMTNERYFAAIAAWRAKNPEDR